MSSRMFAISSDCPHATVPNVLVNVWVRDQVGNIRHVSSHRISGETRNQGLNCGFRPSIRGRSTRSGCCGASCKPTPRQTAMPKRGSRLACESAPGAPRRAAAAPTEHGRRVLGHRAGLASEHQHQSQRKAPAEPREAMGARRVPDRQLVGADDGGAAGPGGEGALSLERDPRGDARRSAELELNFTPRITLQRGIDAPMDLKGSKNRDEFCRVNQVLRKRLDEAQPGGAR